MHQVISCLSSWNELGNVWGSSDWDHVFLVVHEVDVDLDFSLQVALVLAVVGTVVVINNFTCNLNGLWLGIWILVVLRHWDSLLNLDGKVVSS